MAKGQFLSEVEAQVADSKNSALSQKFKQGVHVARLNVCRQGPFSWGGYGVLSGSTECRNRNARTFQQRAGILRLTAIGPQTFCGVFHREASALPAW